MTATWQAVDRLVARAPSLEDLRVHRLHLFAVRRWRSLGRAVPDDLVDEERLAAMVTLAAPAVLQEVRAAVDGPVVLLKGPEAASYYPDPALRPYQDLDLLVADPPAAHAALTAAGFEPIGDASFFIEIHHLRPLQSPRFPLYVELHSRPKWVDGLEPPPAAELIASARPSSVGIDGILALPAAEHALVLAAHAWAHEPLSRLLRIVDVAAVAGSADRGELERLAERWGMRRLWRTTISVSDALLSDGSSPWVLRLWARNLRTARERTVLESHACRAVAPFWALPSGKALAAVGEAISRALRPRAGESWADKLKRAALAVRHAFVRLSEHERALRARR